MATGLASSGRTGVWRNAANPMKRLCMEIRSAARNCEIAAARNLARREARDIPQTFAEKVPSSKKGGVARLARDVMRRLPDMDRDGRAEAQRVLVAFADFLEAPAGADVVETKPPRKHRAKKTERRQRDAVCTHRIYWDDGEVVV